MVMVSSDGRNPVACRPSVREASSVPEIARTSMTRRWQSVSCTVKLVSVVLKVVKQSVVMLAIGTAAASLDEEQLRVELEDASLGD
jgi:hypothetical protein